MRRASTNSGGYYHFTRLELPVGKSLLERLRSYFSQISYYEEPYLQVGEIRHYIQERDLRYLALTPIENLHQTVLDKLQYWRDHRTNLDTKDHLDPDYQQKETQFREALFGFLNTLTDLRSFALSGIDTSLAKELGGDQVGDDIIFHSAQGSLVLHFGWSS